jgi:hypothetical protein
METEINNEIFIHHKIFNELDIYIEFYDLLSFGVMGYVPPGVNAIINLDTHIYSSIQMSIDSIKQILKLGRINDAYALIRKYYDSAIINIYNTLYINDHLKEYQITIDKINNWYLGKEKLPGFKVMKKYIEDSKYVKELNNIIDFDKRYENIRDNCNNEIHYNSFEMILNNDARVYNENRLKIFDQISFDIVNVFIFHLSYIFTINEYYMSSSDYIDALDNGLKPEEDSQYFVAPYIQNIFDNVIKIYRKDIAELIIKDTSMNLA